MKAYFINSKKENCGVYQYGKRLWDVVQHSKLNITYHEVENLNDFNSLDFSDIDVLFFNWIEGGLAGPFGWFNHDVVKKLAHYFFGTTGVGEYFFKSNITHMSALFFFLHI